MKKDSDDKHSSITMTDNRELKLYITLLDLSKETYELFIHSQHSLFEKRFEGCIESKTNDEEEPK